MNNKTVREQRTENLIKQNNNEKLISYDMRFNYFQRLMLRFNNNRAFIFDYLDGSGSELNKKFWSVRSSSRYAFELYSWMANEDESLEFKNIMFEKQLPTINHSNAPSNMDVYFERKNTLFFIESKFTEDTEIDFENLLSISYYKDKQEGNKWSLLERYYNNQDIATKVPSFIVKQMSEAKKYTTKTFFDAKQEITHLVGIINYIRKNKNNLKNKSIRFYNVVYDFGDFENNAASSFINQFKKDANELLKSLFCDVDFIYDIKTIGHFFEDVLEVNLNEKKAFGINTTVSQQLEQFESKNYKL